MQKRKITLELSQDDFRLLDEHVSRAGSSKQILLAQLIAPVLAALRPVDPFRPKYQSELLKNREDK